MGESERKSNRVLDDRIARTSLFDGVNVIKQIIMFTHNQIRQYTETGQVQYTDPVEIFGEKLESLPVVDAHRCIPVLIQAPKSARRSTFLQRLPKGARYND